MDARAWIETSRTEVGVLLDGVDAAEVEALGLAIVVAPRIFLTGMGRSGWIGRMFGLRLMQAGLTVHIAGDATAPAIGRDDLLIVISASGETPIPAHQARIAREQGARVGLVTARRQSTLADLAGSVLVIPGETTRLTIEGGSRLPLATAIEQATLVVLDSLVAWIAERRGESRASMMARHANLE